MGLLFLVACATTAAAAAAIVQASVERACFGFIVLGLHLSAPRADNV